MKTLQIIFQFVLFAFWLSVTVLVFIQELVIRLRNGFVHERWGFFDATLWHGIVLYAVYGLFLSLCLLLNYKITNWFKEKEFQKGEHRK